ncbi:hypothetical protein EsH8_II_000005 [Colletotrichum jinshuiense]
MPCHWKKSANGHNSRREDADYAVFDGVRYYREGRLVMPSYKKEYFVITDEDSFVEALQNASQHFGNNTNVGETLYIREGTSVNEEQGTAGTSTDLGVVRFAAGPTGRGNRAEIRRWRRGRRLTDPQAVEGGGLRPPLSRATGRARRGDIESISLSSSGGDNDADDEDRYGDESSDNNDQDDEDCEMATGGGTPATRSKGAGAKGGGKAAQPSSTIATTAAATTSTTSTTGGGVAAMEPYRDDITTLKGAVDGIGGVVVAFDEGKLEGAFMAKGFAAIGRYHEAISGVATRFSDALEREATESVALDFLDPDNFMASRRQALQEQASTPAAAAVAAEKAPATRKRKADSGEDGELEGLPPPKMHLRDAQDDGDAVRASTWRVCALQLGGRLAAMGGGDLGAPPRVGLVGRGDGDGDLCLWALCWNGKVVVAPKAFVRAVERFVGLHLSAKEAYNCLSLSFLKTMLRGEYFPIFTEAAAPRTPGPSTSTAGLFTPPRPRVQQPAGKDTAAAGGATPVPTWRLDTTGAATTPKLTTTTATANTNTNTNTNKNKTGGGGNTDSGSKADAVDDAAARKGDRTAVPTASPLGGVVTNAARAKAAKFWKEAAANGEVRGKIARVTAASMLITSHGGVEYWSRVTRDDIYRKAEDIDDELLTGYLGIDVADLPLVNDEIQIEEEDDWDSAQEDMDIE